MPESPRVGSPSVGARALWRQISAAPAAAVIIIVATLLTTLFVTSVPRILERVSEEDLRETLVEAEPEQRNIRAESIERIRGDFEDDPFAQVGSRGDSLLTQGFPESIQSIVGESRYLVETPQFRVSSFPDGIEGPFPTTFSFRYQEGIDDHMTLVSGALPEETEPIPMLFGDDCPQDRLAVEDFEESPETDCLVVEVPVFEAAVTSETAEAMMLEVGDRVTLLPDSQDRLWFIAATPEEQTYVLSISGIISPDELSEEYWYADPSLHRPRIMENPDFRIIHATGLMAPEGYDQMFRQLHAHGFRYTWRYFVDPGLVDATEAEELRANVRRILPPNDESIVTFLDELISDYLDQRALTVSLMSTAVTGVTVAAVGLVLVLAALIADRNATGTILIRDRGASRYQLGLTAAYTGLLLVVPASILGHLVTTFALADTDGLIPGRGSAAIAVGGTAAVVVAGSPYAFRRLAALQRRDARVEKSPGRRAVLEVFTMVAAVASVILLRRRGLADPVQGSVREFDLLLAAAPAVIGIAAGLLVLRLLAPLMRLFSWLGARRRDAVAFVGFRRLMAQPGASRAPIVVVLLAMAVAIFSAVVRVAVDEGQDRHSWQVVGGDFRVDSRIPGVPLPESLDGSALAGGRPWAEGAQFPDTRVLGLARLAQVRLLAIDVDDYRRVLSESGSEVPALEALATGATVDRPIPVLVSSHWGPGGAPATGTQMALEMGSVDPPVVVAETVDYFPSLPVDEPFVVIGLDSLREAWGDVPVRPNVLYGRAPPAETDRLVGEVSRMVRTTSLTSRYQMIDELAGDPLAVWVDRGLAITFYLAIAFGIVASLSLLTVTASHRRRDLGYLRTLGLTRRQAMAITALEQIPPLMIAALAGAVTGAVVAELLAPALDLDSFTGGLIPIEIGVDPMTVFTVSGVMVVVLSAAVISFIAATGDEEYRRPIRSEMNR